MRPYKPPQKNPGVPPGGAPRMPNPVQVPNPAVNPTETTEVHSSWINKHPVWFLAFSGLVTAAVGVFVTHYLGGALRKREERARMQGALAEAEALGEEPVENPEPTVFDRMDGLEEKLTAMSRHFGLPQ